MIPLRTTVACTVGLAVSTSGCGADPSLALPVAGRVCSATANGALPETTVLDGEGIDTLLTASGTFWGDAGLWGPTPCGELFAGVAAEWTAPHDGQWRVTTELAETQSPPPVGTRLPILSVWSTDSECRCRTREVGAIADTVQLNAGERLGVLVGLEATADHQTYLDRGRGYAVHWHLQVRPESP